MRHDPADLDRPLDRMKERLLSHSDLAALADEFFTLMERSPQIMEASLPTEQPQVQAALGQIAAELLEGPAHVLATILLRFASSRFVHGAFLLDGRPGTLFFFEDLGVGLATLTFGLDGQTHVARFTCLASDPTWS